MLWLSRKDIEHISRRLLRDYLKKVPQKVDHIDPADFAEKMCGLQFRSVYKELHADHETGAADNK